VSRRDHIFGPRLGTCGPVHRVDAAVISAESSASRATIARPATPQPGFTPPRRLPIRLVAAPREIPDDVAGCVTTSLEPVEAPLRFAIARSGRALPAGWPARRRGSTAEGHHNGKQRGERPGTTSKGAREGGPARAVETI